MAEDVIIRVEHVYAGYEGIPILEDINFQVRRGEVFVILGGMTKRTVGGTTQTMGQVDRRRKKDATYTETSTTTDDERAELTWTLIRYQ